MKPLFSGTLILALIAVSVAGISKPIKQSAYVSTVQITSTDAIGRVRTSSAEVTQYSSGNTQPMIFKFRSDQLLCSAFGP